MRDKWLRFDTVVAACALLMSTITAGAMIYQTRVIADQFSASTWPYLSVETTYNPNDVEIDLVNNGAGPALIRSAQLIVDGEPVSGWGDLLAAFARGGTAHKTGASLSMGSVDASTAVRAAETHQLFSIKASPAVIERVRRHTVTLAFCYCSIGDRCWTLRNDIGSNALSIPHPAASCKIGASISSPLTL